MKYCRSKGYAPSYLKRMAATALVTVYPTLRMGMSISEAVKGWQTCFTTKLTNWRKRGKLVDPMQPEMKVKYTKNSTGNSNTRKTRSQPCVQVNETEEDREEQELLKETMKTEMGKPHRQRNVRQIDLMLKKTFPLRRKFILEEAPHVKELIREWPSLKVECMMLKEFSLVAPEVAEYVTFELKLDSILGRLMDEARSRASAYATSHPLVRLIVQIPWLEKSDPDFNTDLNLIGANAGLAYSLPTTTKKLADTHRYIVDVCGANTPAAEIVEDISDRHLPFIAVFLNTNDISKIMIYVDRVPVMVCSTMSKALYILLAYYFVLNVSYSDHVATVLEFIQLSCLGLPVRRPHIRVREYMQKLQLFQ